MSSDWFKTFGLDHDEIFSWLSRAHETIKHPKTEISLLITQNKNERISKIVAECLWKCETVASAIGKIKKIQISKDAMVLHDDGSVKSITEFRKWSFLLERLYSDPLSIENKAVWLFFQAIFEAQRDFALDVCPPTSNETFLTGRFVGSIKTACDAWSHFAAPYLSRSNQRIAISQIDLSVGGYEQKTGGDLALILDIEESPIAHWGLNRTPPRSSTPPQRNSIIPIVFQAKRYTGKRADISEHHNVRGYQFDMLRQTTCASSYIFFENGPTRIEYPALPMVKASSSCAHPSLSPRTEVFENSLDFATYILQAIDGSGDAPAAKTREDALNMILANASPDRIGQVVILGNKSGLDVAYANALATLRRSFLDEPPDENLYEKPRP